MTAATQDISTTGGDSELPTFTVTDQTGAAIDISTVSEIVFTVQETIEATPVITKSKTGGKIALVSGGTTGKFSVTLDPADTQNLAGYFIYQAKITDSLGNVTTVSSGSLRIIRSVPA